MTSKEEFIHTYIPKTGVWFDTDVFLTDEKVAVRSREVPIEEMDAYYIPRYIRDEQMDDRHFSLQVGDLLTQPVKLARVVNRPQDWDLLPRAPLPSHLDLWPIPIAMDTTTGRTLILDSNHTLTNLRARMDHASVNVIEIYGPEMERLIADFKVINRA